jgi:hypothetical protein
MDRDVHNGVAGCQPSSTLIYRSPPRSSLHHQQQSHFPSPPRRSVEGLAATGGVVIEGSIGLESITTGSESCQQSSDDPKDHQRSSAFVLWSASRLVV